jgi:hypothetical protein
MIRRLTVVTLAIGLTLSAPAAAAARAFDLECDHARYRIDEARRRWCEGDCTTLRTLRFMRDGEGLILTSLAFWEISYSRKTGMVSRSFGGMADGGYILNEPCRVRPFSGFPRKAIYRPTA